MIFAARWYPRCYKAEQVLSGDYDSVMVTYDLAPEEMNFDRYKVLLYQCPPAALDQEEQSTCDVTKGRYVGGDIMEVNNKVSFAFLLARQGQDQTGI